MYHYNFCHIFQHLLAITWSPGSDELSDAGQYSNPEQPSCVQSEQFCRDEPYPESSSKQHGLGKGNFGYRKVRIVKIFQLYLSIFNIRDIHYASQGFHLRGTHYFQNLS